MGIKALFFDVDGTLLDDKTKEIPRSTIDVIKEVREQGNKVFINTGRVLCMLGDINKKIEVDGLICGCVTHIIIGDKTIYENIIPLYEANHIKDSLNKYKIGAVLEAKKRAYMQKRPFLHEKLESFYELVSSWCEVRVDAFNDKSYTFDKFCILCDKEKQKVAFESFIKEADKFEVIDRGSSFFEFVPKGNSKGEAILKVLDYYNIPLEDAYVFGDSMNDVSMFTCGVKNRIIMGEHDAGLLEFSTFKTKKVLEDGIEYAIRSLGII